MKPRMSIVLLLVFAATTALVNIAVPPAVAGLSGLKTVGPAGDYSSLTSAFAAIVTDSLSGALVLELEPDYVSTVETFPVTAGVFPGSSSSNILTIRPSADAEGLSIVSDSPAGTLDLNGATYMIVDGRPGGTGTGRELTVENTSTSGSGQVGWAIRFINGAQFNTIRYVIARGAHSGVVTGVVVFGSTTGDAGNSNNTVEYCDLGDGVATPTNIVYAGGMDATGLRNRDDRISHCNIFNFYSPTLAQAGVLMSAGNSYWTIDGNSFYQTSTRQMSGGNSVECNAICSASFRNNGSVITGNYIGGSAPECGGSQMTYRGNVLFRAFRLTVGDAARTEVQENTFRNISVTSYSPSPFQTLIALEAGSFNVGTGSPNQIGSQTETGSIVFALSDTGAVFSGILVGTGSAGPMDISNNTIGGISVTRDNGAGDPAVRGISLGNEGMASPVYTISNNVIGAASLSNSFTGSTGNHMAGIYAETGGYGLNSFWANITDNTIANLGHLGTGAGQLFGICCISQASAASYIVTGNTVRDLDSRSTSTLNGSKASVIGISLPGVTGSQQTVARNTIYNLSNSDSLATTAITGIYYFRGNDSGTNVVEANSIHSLKLATGSVDTAWAAQITGIYVDGGKTTFLNNMVRLGLDGSGNALTVGYPIAGINEIAGSNEFYGNTVYIGGSEVASGGPTFAFETSVSKNTRSYKDNIFVNARSNGSAGGGKNYAIRIPRGTMPLAGMTCDYNDLYSSGEGGVLGGVGGRISITDCYTLPEWTAATTFDSNSKSADPLFMTPDGGAATGDLHIVTTGYPPSPIANAGTPLALLVEDFDGDTRGPAPDMGADEILNYVIVATVEGRGSISPAGTVVANPGSSIEFAMAADDWWEIWDVIVDGLSQGPLETYTFYDIQTDHGIQAIFEETSPPSAEITAPNGGEIWEVGTTEEITWTATSDTSVTAVDLDYSTDGGATYPYPIAAGIENTGSHEWLVPDTPGETVRVRVTVHDAVGGSAADASDADFEIYFNPAGIPGPQIEHEDGIRVYPNPASAGETHVFCLTKAAGVIDVSVYDVSGRRIRRLKSGFVGAGFHDIRWDGRDDLGGAVSAGIYFVHFTTGSGVNKSRRLAVLR